MIALLLGLAFAHGPGECPPLSVFQAQLSAGPLTESLRSCMAEARSRRPGSLVLWRDRLYQEGATPSVRSELLRLASASAQSSALIETAEFLSVERPEWSRALMPMIAARLRAEQWSTRWVRRAARYFVLDDRLNDAPEHLLVGLLALGIDDVRVERARLRCGSCCEGDPSDVLSPASATSVDECPDLGRLMAGVLYGGVYASERDCVVRRVESQTGEARVRMSQLAWQLALSYGGDSESDRLDRAVVRHRLIQLGGEGLLMPAVSH